MHLTWQSERTRSENNWYAVTGRVVAVKVEADGDLHIELSDATGDNRESLFAKYRHRLSGVKFAQQFLVGRGRGFLFTPAPLGS